jgi:uncharacterized protein (TIGR02246 family)
MWMVVRVQDIEIVHQVLDRWKAGIDAGDPQRIAEVFTENAIFQGLHPYSVGRHGVVEYYSAQPSGMTVTYRLLETRRPAHDLVLGYAKVDFAFPDRPTVDVYLGVLLERGEDGWRIGHYQVSRLGG